MATITLQVPEDLKRDLEENRLIGWEKIAVEALQNRMNKLKVLKAIASKSKLSEEEAEKLALDLGRKVRAGIHKRHLEQHRI